MRTRYKLYIIGMGPGDDDYIIPAALDTIDKCGYVISSVRYKKFIEPDKYIKLTNVNDALEKLPMLLLRADTAICVAGDPLMYSMLATIHRRFPAMRCEVVPGIGSIQIMASRFGITTEDAKIVSTGGKTMSQGTIAGIVAENTKTFFYCSRQAGPAEIAQALIRFGLLHIKMFVGTNLSYSNEHLFTGTPEVIAVTPNPEMCVCVCVNTEPKKFSRYEFIEDSYFMRSPTVPMTKKQVRILAISELDVHPESIVWDIGCGTGSISIEAARRAKYGTVYAIDLNGNACNVTEENKNFFGCENIEVKCDRASDILHLLPEPDRVFIDEVGSDLPDTIKFLGTLERKIKVVVTAVTLETQATAFALLHNKPQFNAYQAAISPLKTVGRYNLLQGGNPVMIYSAYIG